MDEKEIQLMIDSTKLLRDMCQNNFDYTSTLKKELQSLVEVTASIAHRVSELEKNNEK